MSAILRFDPSSYHVFRLINREYDPVTRTITLRYGLDDRIEFVETITFETSPSELAEPRSPGSFPTGSMPPG